MDKPTIKTEPSTSQPSSLDNKSISEAFFNKIKDTGLFDQFRQECLDELMQSRDMASLRERVRMNIRNDLARAAADPRRRGALITRNTLRELVRESNQLHAASYEDRIRSSSRRVVAHRMHVSLGRQILYFICGHLSQATSIASSLLATQGTSGFPGGAAHSPVESSTKTEGSQPASVDAESSARPLMERFRRTPRDEDSSPEPPPDVKPNLKQPSSDEVAVRRTSTHTKRRAAVSALPARTSNDASERPHSSDLEEPNAANPERTPSDAAPGAACVADRAPASHSKESDEQSADMCIDAEEPEPDAEKPEASESESISIAAESDAEEREQSSDRQDRSASASTSIAAPRDLRTPEGSIGLKSPPIRFSVRQQAPQRLQASSSRIFSVDVGQRVELMSPDRQDSPLTSPVTGLTSMSESRDASPHPNRPVSAASSRRRHSPNASRFRRDRDWPSDSGRRRSRDTPGSRMFRDRREHDFRPHFRDVRESYSMMRSPTSARRSDRGGDERWADRHHEAAHESRHRAFTRDRERERERHRLPQTPPAAAGYESGSWRAKAIRIQRPPSDARNSRNQSRHHRSRSDERRARRDTPSRTERSHHSRNSGTGADGRRDESERRDGRQSRESRHARPRTPSRSRSRSPSSSGSRSRSRSASRSSTSRSSSTSSR